MENLRSTKYDITVLYNDNVIVNSDSDPSEFIGCMFIPENKNISVKTYILPFNSVTQEAPTYREILNTIINFKTSVITHQTVFLIFYDQMNSIMGNEWREALSERYNMYIYN